VTALGVLCGGPPAPAAAVAGDTPIRVVALAPSVTEIAYALGVGDRLVGACGQCDYPAQAAALPRVGGYLAPSVEAVLGLKPDLALVVPSPGNREAVRAIERAGVRTLILQDRVLRDLWDAIAQMASTFGRVEAGQALTAKLQSQLEAIRTRAATHPRRRVLLVVGHRPLIVAGGGTLQDELLTIAGGDNVARDAGDAWPQLSLEAVIARAPEIILDAGMGTEAGGEAVFRDLAMVPAVRDGRIVRLQADEIFRAGPRVVQAAERLAAVIGDAAGR
jgi:iron complex transport system substrate-binding protein